MYVSARMLEAEGGGAAVAAVAAQLEWSQSSAAAVAPLSCACSGPAWVASRSIIAAHAHAENSIELNTQLLYCLAAELRAMLSKCFSPAIARRIWKIIHEEAAEPGERRNVYRIVIAVVAIWQINKWPNWHPLVRLTAETRQRHLLYRYETGWLRDLCKIQGKSIKLTGHKIRRCSQMPAAAWATPEHKCA